MKQALTVGCGSGNSSAIIDTLLEKGYQVINIGTSGHPGATNITVQWSELQITTLHKLVDIDGNLDFVFFSQNGSSLNSDNFDFANTPMLEAWKLVKDWQQSHWISCQMPFLLLHTLKKHLTPKTKIGWMLSSNMMWNNPNVDQYPDYSSQKYFNYLAMRCAGKHYQTFGIMPNFSVSGSQNRLKEVIEQVCDTDVNCQLFEVK